MMIEPNEGYGGHLKPHPSCWDGTLSRDTETPSKDTGAWQGVLRRQEPRAPEPCVRKPVNPAQRPQAHQSTDRNAL